VPYVQRALDLARSLADQSLELAALQELEADYAALADYAEVARYSAEIVQLARAMGDRDLVAEKLATSGYAYEQVGNFQRAAAQYQTALGAYRDIDDARGEWRVLDDLGRLALKQGDTTEAITRYQDAFQVAQRGGLREGQVSTLERTAAAYRSVKDYAKATQYYQQALKAAKDGKLREYEWLVLSDLGSMFGEMGNPQGAVAHYREALTVVRQLGDKEAEQQIRDAMARFEKASGTKDTKPSRKR
jgi:tetratricopeptide (TPR) repeat protein